MGDHKPEIFTKTTYKHSCCVYVYLAQCRCSLRLSKYWGSLFSDRVEVWTSQFNIITNDYKQIWLKDSEFISLQAKKTGLFKLNNLLVFLTDFDSDANNLTYSIIIIIININIRKERIVFLQQETIIWNNKIQVTICFLENLVVFFNKNKNKNNEIIRRCSVCSAGSLP